MALPSQTRRSFFTKVMSLAAGAWVGASAAWSIGCSPAVKYGGPPEPPPPPPPEPPPTSTMVEPSPPPAPSPEPSPSPEPTVPVVKYGGPPRH